MVIAYYPAYGLEKISFSRSIDISLQSTIVAFLPFCPEGTIAKALRQHC
jgi:hypothetical protein